MYHCTVFTQLDSGSDCKCYMYVTCKNACLQEDVRSIEAGLIPMPKYANSQAAFYAVQQAPPPMPMPPPIPIETSATVSNCACQIALDVALMLHVSSRLDMLPCFEAIIALPLSAALVCAC